MARIHRLPPSLIAEIAAGEVIERPAYVIKELVENSLDAGATEIDIHFTQAGMEKIVVFDNGVGMSAEDLGLAVLPHHTSKLADGSNLSDISSYGFRGEALPSIGAVSKLTLHSKTAQEDRGHLIHVDNRQISTTSPHGMATGTQVLVERLFYRVPARRKFLTNLKRERQLIIDTVTRLALTAPQVAFRLQNHRPILDLPSDTSTETRLSRLFSQQTIQGLLPVHYEHTFITISGFIGKPQLARKQNRDQYFSINRRPIHYPTLNSIVRKAYGSLLPPGHTPWFYLHLEMPYALVDSNVHPRKETAAFMDEGQVMSLINNAVVDVLSTQDLSYSYNPNPIAKLQLRDRSTPLPKLHQNLKEKVTPWSVTEAVTNDIQQIADTYLLVADDNGFTIIDQHAAHERILYEQFLEAFEDKKNTGESHTLDESETIVLSAAEEDLWSFAELTLRKIGFKWETFGPGGYRITQIPALLKEQKLQQVIPLLLEDIAANRPVELSDQAHRTLAYLACRSAVMAGDTLNQAQIERLVHKLATTPHNATCPHGRPTRVHFNLDQLEKLFGRS